jgi:hypothetical protein
MILETAYGVTVTRFREINFKALEIVLLCINIPEVLKGI